MADKTKIEWCDSSWNPIVGCTPISEGCAHCYAQSMIRRFWKSWGLPSANPGPVFRPEKLDVPYHWRKPRRIFVCSMSDLFHEAVDFEWIDRVMAVVSGNTEHTFMVLTKRPHIMAEYMDQLVNGKRKVCDASVYKNDGGIIDALCVKDWMESGRPNLWIGATVENQSRADERIPILLQIPAAVRFVSIEPMLGPVDLRLTRATPCSHPGCMHHVTHPCEKCGYQAGRRPLDWVIVGGETGPGNRPMLKSWVESVSKQCRAANVPYFFKKWGAFEGRMGRELSCLEARELERREFPREES